MPQVLSAKGTKAASQTFSLLLAILANDYFPPRISMEVMVWLARAILLGSSPHYCAAFAPIIENCAQRVKPAATAEVIPRALRTAKLSAPRLLSSFPQHSQTHSTENFYISVNKTKHFSKNRAERESIFKRRNVEVCDVFLQNCAKRKGCV
jgi:hypothetical protein